MVRVASKQSDSMFSACRAEPDRSLLLCAMALLLELYFTCHLSTSLKRSSLHSKPYNIFFQLKRPFSVVLLIAECSEASSLSDGRLILS